MIKPKILNNLPIISSLTHSTYSKSYTVLGIPAKLWEMNDDEFICPNCECEEILEQKFLSIEEPNDSNPWSSISQVIKCDSCKKTIPAHLGERWDGITFEEAKKEYLEKYNK